MSRLRTSLCIFTIAASQAAAAAAWRPDTAIPATVNPIESPITLGGDLNFGSVLVGTFAARRLTITNSGDVSVFVTGGGTPSGFSISPLIFPPLPPHSETPITVWFNPTQVAAYGGLIILDTTAGIYTIDASGTGTLEATRVIGLSGDLAFGNFTVGATATRAMTISNSGSAPMTVTGYRCPNGFSGSWSGTIPVGGSQNVEIRFSPTAAVSHGGTIVVVADHTSGGATIGVSGFGIIAPPPPADFNRDRRPDLLWFSGNTRRVAMWNMGGGSFGERFIGGELLSSPALPPSWQVVGAGDLDGDGETDLVLQSDAGNLGAWLFDGGVLRYGVSLAPGLVSDPLWRVRAVADVNHDGHPDLVWQYEPTGQLAFWLMNGVNAIGYAVPEIAAPGADWQVVGAGDSNHDGDLDLFWQHRSQGTLAVWWMNGTEYGAGLVLSSSPADAGWKVVATCDLDGDGSTDLVFQHVPTDTLAAWFLDGQTVRFGAVLTPANAGASEWKVVGPR